MTDFDSMNETDVREIIVRPLLEQLGYRHGTEATIKTEYTLKYDKAFLGRKKPAKDPPLAGRADYICDVISFGRWVVEVKAPSEPLDEASVHQAHTYSAHPEIAATHFMLTNGREFQVYQTGRLDAPTLAWEFEETQSTVLALFNLLGPEAVRKRARLGVGDPGKPLGPGLASRVEIIGGEVTYENHHSDNPLFGTDMINGLKLPVTGGYVARGEDGRLHAHVQMAKSAALFRELNDLMGVDGYDFYSSAEFVSADPNEPTIFQNFITSGIEQGAIFTMPMMGKIPMPFSMSIASVTEAVGFFEGDVFRGVMHLSYDCTFSNISPQVRLALEMQAGMRIPQRSQFEGGGTFEIRLRDAIA